MILIFKEQIKREISLYLESNDSGDVLPPILWDSLRAVLRRKIIAFSSYKKKIINEKTEELQNKRRELERQHKLSSGQKNHRKDIDSLAAQEI